MAYPFYERFWPLRSLEVLYFHSLTLPLYDWLDHIACAYNSAQSSGFFISSVCISNRVSTSMYEEIIGGHLFWPYSLQRFTYFQKYQAQIADSFMLRWHHESNTLLTASSVQNVIIIQCCSDLIIPWDMKRNVWLWLGRHHGPRYQAHRPPSSVISIWISLKPKRAY